MKSEPVSFLWRRTRSRSLAVTPMYKVPLRLLARI